ncbi:hypothetical protein [Roseibium sp.]|uniref:hypothetical protein n=1 Tax=Roseibium sp. TaxID=1936156 RepID=UPI0039EFC9E4
MKSRVNVGAQVIFDLIGKDRSKQYANRSASIAGPLSPLPSPDVSLHWRSMTCRTAHIVHLGPTANALRFAGFLVRLPEMQGPACERFMR